MRKFAGYINLKPINGVLYPSSLQNILMKDYVSKKLNSIFYLSPTEILQAKYSVTLNTLLSNETKVNGIVMLSTFSLPKNYRERHKILKRAYIKKKEIHFILDELIFKKPSDYEKIEEQILFDQDFFTNTKEKLNNYDKILLKKNKISFV